MSDKKKMLLVTNCAGIEIAQQLASSADFMQRYSVEIFSTYVEMADGLAQERLIKSLNDADVVVTQDVKNCDWLRNDEISKHIKKDCVFIRLAFWRFDGFWPIELPRFYNSLWYLPDEFGSNLTFDEYIASPIPKGQITEKFWNEVDKFREIEANSDLKMIEFVMDHHRQINLFSDSWHPTAIFYRQVVSFILNQMGETIETAVLPNIHINRDRYRFIFDAVGETLDLQFDRSLLQFNDHLITRDIFYDFCQHARTALIGAGNPSQAAAAFETWRQERRIEPRPFDVLRLARAQHQAAQETTLEFDLRDFRQISGVALDSATPAEGRSATVATSVDGETWTHLADLDDAASSASVVPTRLARYARRTLAGAPEPSLHGFHLLSNVIGDPLR